jgi:hypothetical protein
MNIRSSLPPYALSFAAMIVTLSSVSIINRVTELDVIARYGDKRSAETSK